jgi:hypothetical protein
VVVVLPGHEFIHELVGSLYDFIDLLYLLLLYLFIAAVEDFLVLAVLLDWSTEGVG